MRSNDSGPAVRFPPVIHQVVEEHQSSNLFIYRCAILPLEPNAMNIYVLDYDQDDPGKCTAKKMVHMGLAARVSRKFHASSSTIVLNPFSDIVLSPNDTTSRGLLVVDCSWNLAREVFFRKVGGKHRRLPALLAANPTNYARLGVLSSLEAVAATLYVLGAKAQAESYLSIFKWGPTFLTLNHDALEEYSAADSEDDVRSLERQFFPSP